MSSFSDVVNKHRFKDPLLPGSLVSVRKKTSPEVYRAPGLEKFMTVRDYDVGVLVIVEQKDRYVYLLVRGQLGWIDRMFLDLVSPHMIRSGDIIKILSKRLALWKDYDNVHPSGLKRWSRDLTREHLMLVMFTVNDGVAYVFVGDSFGYVNLDHTERVA